MKSDVATRAAVTRMPINRGHVKSRPFAATEAAAGSTDRSEECSAECRPGDAADAAAVPDWAGPVPGLVLGAVMRSRSLGLRVRRDGHRHRTEVAPSRSRARPGQIRPRARTG